MPASSFNTALEFDDDAVIGAGGVIITAPSLHLTSAKHLFENFFFQSSCFLPVMSILFHTQLAEILPLVLLIGAEIISVLNCVLLQLVVHILHFGFQCCSIVSCLPSWPNWAHGDCWLS